jgi:hypothetical protein
MDLYAFAVERFIITDTRSKIDDTLALGYSANVNGIMVRNQAFKLQPGDFNNGAYNVVDRLPPGKSPGLDRVVINDPTARVAFSFQLINAGNTTNDTLNGRVAATAEQMATTLLGFAKDHLSLASGYTWAGIALEAFSYFYTWAEANCDGPVAIDQLAGPRYVLDALTDNDQLLVRLDRKYTGADPPPEFCDVSHYEVIWSLSHQREWVGVEAFPIDADPVSFASATGVSAASHYHAVHAFGVTDGLDLGLAAGPAVTHARTFEGDSWTVDVVGSFDLAPRADGSGESLPVSAVDFNDRLYVFGVLKDRSVSSLAFTVDGTSWVTQARGPAGLQTAQAVAIAVFRYRLYLFARDASTNHLLLYRTSDLDTWQSEGVVSEPAGPPPSSIAAISLRGTLHLFGLYLDPRNKAQVVIMHNSTSDGVTWTGWDVVEGGAHPSDPATVEIPQPLDVAAGVFRDRIYLAARWRPTNHIAVNFSGDGADWSGWRIPERDPDPAHFGAGPIPPDLQFIGSAGLAAVGHHLYIFCPRDGKNADGLNVVYAY